MNLWISVGIGEIVHYVFGRLNQETGKRGRYYQVVILLAPTRMVVGCIHRV